MNSLVEYHNGDCSTKILFRVTILDIKKTAPVDGIFYHPAEAVGTYISGPLATKTVGTK